MNFKYGDWNIEIERKGYQYIWTARNSGTFQMIRDLDGRVGDFGEVKGAVTQIKRWIDEYEHNPMAFKFRHSELIW